MTLVEVLVAAFVLAVGVMGVASLLVTTARASSIAELQSTAIDLASGELEIIRSLAYEGVGIAPSADGYLPEVDGRPTVTEATDNLVLPVDTIDLDGVVFRVERAVTWARVGGDERAYKLVEVTVSWDTSSLGTSSGQREIAVQTGLHAGLSGG